MAIAKSIGGKVRREKAEFRVNVHTSFAVTVTLNGSFEATPLIVSVSKEHKEMR